MCVFVCGVLCDAVYRGLCLCVMIWDCGFCSGIWFDVVWLVFVRVCVFVVFFCVMCNVCV